MNVFKCDRCNTVYEITKKCCEGYHITKNPYTAGCIDLCEKCFYELQEWMTVYKETESEDAKNE